MVSKRRSMIIQKRSGMKDALRRCDRCGGNCPFFVTIVRLLERLELSLLAEALALEPEFVLHVMS
jgi:hypothetical protein